MVGVVQSKDINDLCRFLVTESQKIAQVMKLKAEKADQREKAVSSTEACGTRDADVQDDERPTSPGTLALLCDEPDTSLYIGDAPLVVRTRTEEPGLSDTHVRNNQRYMPPGMPEPMHTERDRMLVSSQNVNASPDKKISEVYVEQEKFIMKAMQNFLRILSASARENETNCYLKETTSKMSDNQNSVPAAPVKASFASRNSFVPDNPGGRFSENENVNH